MGYTEVSFWKIAPKRLPPTRTQGLTLTLTQWEICCGGQFSGHEQVDRYKNCYCSNINTFLKISLVENNEIISDESKVTNSFSNFFENAIHSLGIKTNKYSNDNYGLQNPVEIAIKKYEQHPSINLIK